MEHLRKRYNFLLPDTRGFGKSCGFTSFDIPEKYKNLYGIKLSKNRLVDKIKRIKIPILLGHGKKDGLIAFLNGQKLYNANKKIIFLKLSRDTHSIGKIKTRGPFT